MRIFFALLALVFAGWLAVSPPEVVHAGEELLRDRFTRFAASDIPETRVVVVDIDEASLAAVGPWPWPRVRLADLVEVLLADYGVAAVALDMVLPEPADAEGDQRLATLAEHGPLVMAVAFDFVPRQPAITVGHLGRPAPSGPVDPVAATGYVANHAGLARSRCTGNIGVVPDADGVLRRLPMAASSSGHSYPVLAQALLGCTARESVQTPVPDITGRWRVPFRRVLDSYTVIPAADILAQHAPRELLAGRYVIVGASALGLSDRVATPLAASTAGFMVHAAALTALLDTPTAPWPGKLLAAAWTLLLVVLGYAALPRLSALSGMLLLAAGGLAWLPLAYAIAGSGAEFPLSAPLGAGFVLLAGAIPYEWWLAQRDSQRILEMFSHYVAPTVLAELLSHRLDDALAPTAKDVTVLIADMEGYTRHTSSLPLNEAARLTRDFLDALTRPVLDAGGTLDKYTGDGLVAFWGAPLPCPDQAEKALAAGNRILAEVAALNERRQAEGFPAVRVRIGIESGSALVGDLGTPFRSTYTAVGDCINFASKLQEAARDLPADLIVGPGAQARLGDKPELLTPLGTIPVRGSDHDMAVWGPR